MGYLHKRKANLHKGEHYSKELPLHKCHKAYMVLIGPVSIKSKRKYLLTVMDGFTIYADAIPIETKSAKTVTEALTVSLTGVFGGAPLQIVADRGMEFVGSVTRTTMRMLGHNIAFIPANLHQSNMVERFHKMLTLMIRAIRTKGVKEWVPAVRMALQYYQCCGSGSGSVWIRFIWPDPGPGVKFLRNCSFSSKILTNAKMKMLNFF